jgi:hypothetical protein
MTSLREKAESDLGTTLEKEWSLPVVLKGPDGKIYDTSANDGERLGGQVLYDIVRLSPDTGNNIIVNKPVVTLRRTSLERVPQAGERWIVQIPVRPSETAEMEDFILDPDRPPEGGASIGFIRLYLRRAVQKK